MSTNKSNPFTLFGYKFVKSKKDEKPVSFVTKSNVDGAAVVVNAGGHFSSTIDLSGNDFNSEKELIKKYRSMAMNTECDAAIEDIVNEAISNDENSAPVQLVLDDWNASDKVKNQIQEEFVNILELIDFNWNATEYFRRWYIDGRLFFHKIINRKNPKEGLIEIRYIDSTTIRKVRELVKDTDDVSGIEYVKDTIDYYIYDGGSASGGVLSMTGAGISNAQGEIRIIADSICYVSSGIMDSSHSVVLSYLHKAIKPLNQLSMLEDAMVIYRISRAPERRIFYVDVGNLPKGKAEEYMQNLMAKYRNKIMYDSGTGEIQNATKTISMLEDFWLPRTASGRSTEIDTLPGGDNLGQIDDIDYFQKKLYKSLNVPYNRLDQESQFTLGRSSEITRDELKYQRFIDKLRKRFSLLFVDLLKTQLLLKGILNEDEWVELSQKLSFKYMKDNYFTELKELEILSERLNVLNNIDMFTEKYFSKKYVYKNVMFLSDEQIKIIEKQRADEANNSDDNEDDKNSY